MKLYDYMYMYIVNVLQMSLLMPYYTDNTHLLNRNNNSQNFL